MTSGGARNRSGPAPDPMSGRSDARGLSFTALPADGYSGEVPGWPLRPAATDDLLALRELDIWAEAWRSPQAAAWAAQSWRWTIIAEYCRLKAVVELAPAASAALVSQLHRYRDQIGLTPAGLKENGWQIAAAAGSEDAGEAPARASRRLRAVSE